MAGSSYLQRLLDAIAGKPEPIPPKVFRSLQQEYGLRSAADIRALLRSNDDEIRELRREIADLRAGRELYQREFGTSDAREIIRQIRAARTREDGDSEMATLLRSMDKAMKSLHY